MSPLLPLPPSALRGLAQYHSQLVWRLGRRCWVRAALDQGLFFRKYFRCTEVDPTVRLPASVTQRPPFPGLGLFGGWGFLSVGFTGWRGECG